MTSVKAYFVNFYHKKECSMEQKEKILYLEIIRILAIFSVILLHCNAEYFSDGKIFETKTWWLSNTINAASRFGVPVFFYDKRICFAFNKNSRKYDFVL